MQEIIKTTKKNKRFAISSEKCAHDKEGWPTQTRCHPKTALLNSSASILLTSSLASIPPILLVLLVLVIQLLYNCGASHDKGTRPTYQGKPAVAIFTQQTMMMDQKCIICWKICSKGSQPLPYTQTICKRWIRPFTISNKMSRFGATINSPQTQVARKTINALAADAIMQ